MNYLRNNKMTNKDKFLKLVSGDENKTLENIKWRNANRLWLRASQEIAIKVLIRLKELGWSQAFLAEKMEVSPQQISKIVKGKENLTISTIVKLQEILDLALLASYNNKKSAPTNQYEQTIELPINMVSDVTEKNYSKKAVHIDMDYDNVSGEYTYCKKIV
jgi:transcriptional regulator with XRE-family HTH domain